MIETNYAVNKDSRNLYLNQNKSVLNRPSFKSTSDQVELSNKDAEKEEKKSFLQRFGIDIAAFTTGIVGIGAAIRTGRINKKLNTKIAKLERINKLLNQKAISVLDLVGIKGGTSLRENIGKFKKVLVVDGLTGLLNRARLNKYLKDAFSKAKKDGSELHVFMFDIDKFKNVNTALGHDGGDDILRHSSKAISNVVKKYKEKGVEVMFARYGGEEFTLVASGVPKEKAIEIAQEIRASVNQNKDLKTHADNFIKFYKNEADKLISKGNLTNQEEHLLEEYKFLYNHVETNHGFKISGGLCSLKEHSQIVEAPHEAIKLADITLERAKTSGRNKLIEPGDDELAEYAAYKLKDAFERRNINSAK